MPAHRHKTVGEISKRFEFQVEIRHILQYHVFVEVQVRWVLVPLRLVADYACIGQVV
jgi:hypothetical protein